MAKLDRRQVREAAYLRLARQHLERPRDYVELDGHILALRDHVQEFSGFQPRLRDHHLVYAALTDILRQVAKRPHDRHAIDLARVGVRAHEALDPVPELGVLLGATKNQPPQFTAPDYQGPGSRRAYRQRPLPAVAEQHPTDGDEHQRSEPEDDEHAAGVVGATQERDGGYHQGGEGDRAEAVGEVVEGSGDTVDVVQAERFEGREPQREYRGQRPQVH